MTTQFFFQRIRYAENNSVQIDWLSFDAAPHEQGADAFEYIAREFPVSFYVGQSRRRPVNIRWLPFKVPQRGIRVCHDRGERLTYFMSNRSRYRLRVQQLIVSLALQHDVRVGEARFTRSALGKEGSEYLCANTPARAARGPGSCGIPIEAGVYAFYGDRVPEPLPSVLSHALVRIVASSHCCRTDHLVPCMNACISSSVSLPSLLVSIALKIRS